MPVIAVKGMRHQQLQGTKPAAPRIACRWAHLCQTAMHAIDLVLKEIRNQFIVLSREAARPTQEQSRITCRWDRLCQQGLHVTRSASMVHMLSVWKERIRRAICRSAHSFLTEDADSRL